jgi:stalled ribosome alternative rescue factor ArfA
MRASKFKGAAKRAVMQRKYRPKVEEPRKGKWAYKRPSPGTKVEDE